MNYKANPALCAYILHRATAVRYENNPRRPHERHRRTERTRPEAGRAGRVETGKAREMGEYDRETHERMVLNGGQLDHAEAALDELHA